MSSVFVSHMFLKRDITCNNHNSHIKGEHAQYPGGFDQTKVNNIIIQ